MRLNYYIIQIQFDFRSIILTFRHFNNYWEGSLQYFLHTINFQVSQTIKMN
jgi:uncharacterized protein Usg